MKPSGKSGIAGIGNYRLHQIFIRQTSDINKEMEHDTHGIGFNHPRKLA
jgi:hypothetical protein